MMDDDITAFFDNPDNNLKQYRDVMPKLALDQNAKVFVKLNPLNQREEPLQGEFLGTSHYEFLILRLPSLPGLLKKLLPQTRIEVRYMSEGAVNTFFTEIISYSVKPTLLLFTSYPDTMSIKETRKYHRVMCALPTVINTEKGDAEGIISDLSLGGCKISLELSGQPVVRELVIGDQVIMQTVLNVSGLPCGGAAIIRNIEIMGTRFIAGLSFVEKAETFLTPLSKYIHMLQMLN